MSPSARGNHELLVPNARDLVAYEQGQLRPPDQRKGQGESEPPVRAKAHDQHEAEQQLWQSTQPLDDGCRDHAQRAGSTGGDTREHEGEEEATQQRESNGRKREARAPEDAREQIAPERICGRAGGGPWRDRRNLIGVRRRELEQLPRVRVKRRDRLAREGEKQHESESRDADGETGCS